jgi:hypothetical protein
MQIEEFQTLVENNLVRLVLNDGTFHVVTLWPRLCSPEQRGVVATGSVAVWSGDRSAWIAINPAEIFAHQVVKID